ncbi:hypothetical protein [Komagataeibacter rhaeticus]|uniref:hypothetical protein n=1 Tax=Komagataeibacter rhaeticus TaxID=215221 RepID=UPI0039E8312D
MPRKPAIIMPTDEENALINRGITSAPDSPELTAADFRNARPARSVVPELASAGKLR